MLTFSLALNLVVLFPVCAGLLMRKPRMTSAFGEWTPARGILLSIYLAIAVASAALLARPDPRMASVLLGLQVIYKVTTPFTVRTVKNPVVISNLLIAAVHLVTLYVVVLPALAQES
jgi:hypothetical protein